MISNHFLSGYLLSDALEEVNSFIKRNEGEIVVLDIKQDTSGAPTPAAAVDLQIAKLVSSTFDHDILRDDTYIDDFISTYGGIYLTGFDAS